MVYHVWIDLFQRLMGKSHLIGIYIEKINIVSTCVFNHQNRECSNIFCSIVSLCFASSPVECSCQTGVPYQGSLDLSANYPALAVIH